ncbi:hypothetical protein MJG53_015183 [Ovis ammon polii x Ovis aries]|uniref:Uncharacterized protein n=1 Tax=Ovis ammon polii x Ovis aries TaxID=2918886 RepID=A0ACB9UEC6_9CETA|nr:hypothetical protein MJG53_015183 [Ovis ammon polii x Ovis aries]
MAQDDRGALQRDCPTGPADCYHLSYLEEIPLSGVTLDACYGDLEGIMKLDDLTYEIKPLMCSERFEHVVSQIVADTSGTGPAFRPDHKDHIVITRIPLPPEVDVSVAPRVTSRMFVTYPSVTSGLVLVYDVRDPTRMNDYNVPNGPCARYHAATFLPYGDPSTAFIFHHDGPSLTQFESELYVLCNSPPGLA